MNNALIATGTVLAGGVLVAVVWSIAFSGESVESAESEPPERILVRSLDENVTPSGVVAGFDYLRLAENQSGSRSGQDFRTRIEELRARFDLDGDGELSQEERKQMIEEMRSQRAADRLARFDSDGDGVLSEEEERAARLSELLAGRRGQALAKEFDVNGDGVLDADEVAALEADWQRRRDERAQRAIDLYDQNGDGELDEIEREIARESQREQMGLFRDRITSRFDADGNGELSPDERFEARQSVRSLFQQRAFVNNNDFNGDGIVNSADMADFVDRFSSGDPTADLNGDGVFDAADLDEYNRRISEGENTLPSEDELPPIGAFRGGGGGRGGGG